MSLRDDSRGLTAETLTCWTGGSWQVPPTEACSGVTQDSRSVVPGMVYVALRGARLDGHAFVASAFKRGASAVVVAKDWAVPEALARMPLLRVDDPAKALLDIARGYRNMVPATWIGITGSAGKTTFKELLAAMLSGGGETAATQGNLNNAVGLPLSILAVPKTARYAVIEAGISHPGDMDPLADALLPDMAALSSIGPAHIAFFGSERAIAEEKGKLLRAVPQKGVVVLAPEIHEAAVLRASCRCRVVTCSLHGSSADYVGKRLSDDSIQVFHEVDEPVTLVTGLSGLHNASNVLTAYALARECGLSPAQILTGLAAFKSPPMRWERVSLDHLQVINDAYNANPLSMKAALITFAEMVSPGTKVVCVGDMLELGEASSALHRQVGETVGNGPWRLLVGIGSGAASLVAGAVAAGFPRSRTILFPTTEAAERTVAQWIYPGDVVLLKASRGMHFETLVRAMRQV